MCYETRCRWNEFGHPAKGERLLYPHRSGMRVKCDPDQIERDIKARFAFMEQQLPSHIRDDIGCYAVAATFVTPPQIRMIDAAFL